MGYRHYFYMVDKKNCEAVKKLTYDELVEHAKQHYPEAVEIDEYDDGTETYLNFHKILGQDCIFEFGKLYWDDTADRIYAHGEPLFANKETFEEFVDYHPYVMGKEGLEEAVAIYKQKIINYYKDLLVDGAEISAPFGITFTREDIKSIDKIHEHIHDQLRWWQTYAVDMDMEHPELTRSWLYEHQIFELVRLYKSIDWDEKCLLFYGR